MGDKEKILTKPSRANLGAQVEQNLVQWVRFKGRLPDVELHCDDDAVWTLSISGDEPNQVCSTRFKPESADARISEILGYYRYHLRAANWWVGPGATPEDLGNRLRDHGLRCRKHVPGMAVDLRAFDATLPTPHRLVVDAIEDLSVFQKFEHPSIGPISTPRRAARLDRDIRLARLKPRHARYLMASLDGEPLGIATLFLGADVAGIYELAVIPRARGQGIGTVLTLSCLQLARRLGYRVAVLQASGKGESIYRRIGFNRVCTISHWYYPKAKCRIRTA